MGSMFHLLQPTDPYYRRWAAMRHRNRLSWLLRIAGFLAGLEVGLITGRLWLAPVVWMITVIPAVFYFAVWPCPRCGNPFYFKPPRYQPGAQNCVHCNLPQYAPHEKF